MAAQNDLFGIHRRTSDYGCTKRLIPGTRLKNQRVWIAESSADIILRTPEWYLIDGRLGANGVPKVTSAMSVLSPSAFSSDALHVCSEGPTRDRPRIFLPEIRGFRSLRSRTRPHTYSNSLILSLEDLPICKGSELDEIAFVIFPLVAAVEALPDQIAAASLIGYWLCLRIMASYWQLSADRITVAQRATSVAKELWMALAPEIFKMRCHASSNAEE
ncbi:hypothetical protein Q1695_006860 [Nippostrongylus brasiliensis]|nr:hypothetical protein Q1695_006860 [Nippostrongylus brasiliensis]